jgi:hypothetical protein
MGSGPIPFPVWALETDLPWSDDEPGLNEAWLDSVSVHYGQPFTDGPGAIVTSYDPRPAFVNAQRRPDAHCFGCAMRGPWAIGQAMALRFTEVLGQQESVSLAEAHGRLVSGQVSLRDVAMQLGDFLIPALEFGVGLPEATVIVSADLLVLPVALGLWRWHVNVPVLAEVSFE